MQEHEEEPEGGCLQDGKSFELARIHIGVHVDEKGNIKYGYVLREVFDAWPCPYEHKGQELDCIDVEEVCVIESSCIAIAEWHLSPKNVAARVHNEVHDHYPAVSAYKLTFTDSISV